ncbi:hypothetical protein RQP46_003573 [Phenoliferia psychrophenolica]
MAPAVVPESAVLSVLSVTEKLLVAQAVYQVGSGDLAGAAKLLLGHPLLQRAGRTTDFFSTKMIKEVFEAMLAGKDIGLDPKATYAANGPPLLKVAKKYYMQRVVELRALMQLEEDKFRINYLEIQEIKSGAWDSKIDDPEPPQISTRPSTPMPTTPYTNLLASQYEDVYNGGDENKGTWTHEAIGGAAAFAAAKAYEDKCQREGKPASHALAKEMIAGIAGAEVDKLFETKGLDFIDREKAKRHAEQQAQQAINEGDFQ